MRVSTPYQFMVARQRITDTNGDLFVARQKVSTGKRINSLSDDPMGVGSVVTMRSLQSGLGQYSANIDRSSTWLKNTEGSLSEVQQLLTRANAIAVSGANATTSLTERSTMAEEVNDIQKRILQLSNTKDANGEYIFSGTATNTQPFAETATGLTYQGNSANVRIEAGPGQQVTVNAQGQSLFTDIYTRLEALSGALISGNSSQIGTQGIQAMQASMTDLNSIRAQVGVNTRQLEGLKEQHTRRVEDLTQGISNIEDVDLTEAIMDMKNAETAYQASLQVASQGFGLSLMDFIRG